MNNQAATNNYFGNQVVTDYFSLTIKLNQLSTVLIVDVTVTIIDLSWQP